MASQPSSILSPDRPPSFVRNLARLPQAMIKQILNDLSIARVLQILCYGNDAMKDCVFSHRQYSQLFPSRDHVAPLLEVYRLYSDICRFTHQPVARPSFYMSNVYRHTQHHRHYDQTPAWKTNIMLVQKDLMHAILHVLGLSTLEQQLLSAHSTDACPEIDIYHFETLKARWKWIKETKPLLNAAKARQLNMVADIMEEHPGRLRLKKLLDPSQDGPRPNTQHIVDRFRGTAKRVAKDRRVNHSTRFRCSKAVDCVEVVPYDKYLWLFLDTMKKYPPANEQSQLSEVEGLLEKLTLEESMGRKFPYPEKISTSITIVNKGLLNVYTGSPVLIVPRIDWSNSDCRNPTFSVDATPHPPNLHNVLAEVHRCAYRKVMLYDEQEYKWLKAFLEVVTWMEDNLSEMGSTTVSL